MAKRLIYPKDFVRHEEDDFRDDGNYFKGYKYKNILPISSLSCDGEAYISIRMDYLGFDYDLYCEDREIEQEFNGVLVEDVDMEKLAQNCEYLIEKYINDPAMMARNEEIKAQKTLRFAKDRVEYRQYEYEVALEFVTYLKKKRELAEKYDRYFESWELEKAEKALTKACKELQEAQERVEELEGVA